MATTLGKPAIPTPAALDLRALQQTIDNIRERFARLETMVSANGRMLASGPQATAATDLLRAVAALRAELDVVVAAIAGGADDIAPAPRRAHGAPDDLAPAASVSRAEWAALTARVEALELE